MRIIGDVARNAVTTLESQKDADGLITLRGEGSRVQIGQVHDARGFSISVGSYCDVVLHDNIWINGLWLHCEDGGRVSVGSWTGFTGRVEIASLEGRAIIIGNNCLFANGVVIRTGDSHSIFDLDTKGRINQAADVAIGRRVWLCDHVQVLKGVTIGAGSVVGINSVVTEALPAYCLAVGSPARVVRKRVTWDIRLSDRLPPEADKNISDDIG